MKEGEGGSGKREEGSAGSVRMLGIEKSFGPVRALRGASLEVMP
ncbi:MAG: hypothetical protein QOD47_2846, partial [Gemmatimonadaceae bacterium]|nr:hypothetical protein [Gemmatimonadaceae bacterium]